jgi:hypothetical protein
MGGSTKKFMKSPGMALVSPGTYLAEQARSKVGGMFKGPKNIKAPGMSAEAYAGESEAIARQRAIANGQAPSISQMTMNRNVDQINQQAMAMAASQRGASNPALAFRQAQMGSQQAGLEAAQQGAILAEQERRTADDFLARQAAAQRGVAIQTQMANQQNAMAQRGQNMQLISGVGTTAAAMASDEDAKKNIKEEDNVAKAIEQFTSALKGYEYEYKDGENGTGKKVGVMAQDLEKSKIGKTMVDEDENGVKRVDTNKAIGALLAATAEMSKKISKLEKKG